MPVSPGNLLELAPAEQSDEKVYVCCATRLPDQVILGYYTVEKD